MCEELNTNIICAGCGEILDDSYKSSTPKVCALCDPLKKDGKWVHKERLINRGNNRYKEVITDPESGELLHSCEEKLSDHQGHGAAKCINSIDEDVNL